MPAYPTMRRRAAPYAILAVVVAAAYAPGLTGDLLSWDDGRIVADNPLVGPPYVANTVRLFVVIQNEAYQPLHVASYQIDALLWNLHPVGCHLLNLLLFVAGAGLLMLLLRRLGVGEWTALAGALLFALHPSHVESVVWISCRKDVLSLCLVAGSLLLHVRSERLWDRHHVLSILLFALAGLTKTTILFLPLLLPLIDLLALKRPVRESVIRSLPAVGVTLVLGILVWWIWQSSGLTRPLPPEGSRLALMFSTLAHYVATLLWPVSLSPLYPVDRQPGFDGAALAGLALLATLLTAAWLARRRAPMATLGIAVFLLALLPVSNLVPLYFQVNDRYLLLPTFGLPFLVAAAHGPLGRWKQGRVLAFCAAMVVAGIFGGMSFNYSLAWRTDDALWTWAGNTQPDSYYVWMKLGETLRDDGEFDDADLAYDRAIELEPELLPARGARLLNCLLAESGQGPPEMADVEAQAPRVSAYMKATGNPRSTLLVGLQLLAAGRTRCGSEVVAEAIAMDPPFPDYVLLGMADDMLKKGHVSLAGLALDRVSEAGKSTAGYRKLHEQFLVSSPSSFPL